MLLSDGKRLRNVRALLELGKRSHHPGSQCELRPCFKGKCLAVSGQWLNTSLPFQHPQRIVLEVR
jgi:hypothetical protein